MKNKQIRIAKLISHFGFCSRRDAEKLILNGDVKINNKVFKEFYICRDLINTIKVKNKALTKKKTKVWILNKPVGYVCSNNEQFGQKSLFRLIPSHFPRVVSVGRLDINTDGLIILTNNPSLSSFLEDPVNKIERQYIVKVSGAVPNDLDKKVTNPLIINGIIYRDVKIKPFEQKKDYNIIKVKLFEGKNREIRKILNYFNLKVKKLTRTNFGPFNLNKLEIGKLLEINNLKLKKKLISIKFKHEDHFRKI